MIFIVAGFSIIIAFGQLFVNARRVENYNLSGLFLCMGILLTQYGFIFNGTVYHYPGLLFPHLTLTALLGSLVYNAYYYVGMPGRKLSRIKLLFPMQAVLMLAPDIAYVMLPHGEKLAIVMVVILIEGYITGSLFLLKLFSGLLCVSIIGAFVISQRHPGFLHLVILETVKGRYNRSRLDGVDIGATSAKLYGRLNHSILLPFTLKQ